MTELAWVGKKAVENHHREVPYRLLKCDPSLSVGDPEDGNLLVEGDNLEALKALLPFYRGQVKCIYIDPPYNTGQDERDSEGRRTGWIYSDNLNSPEIREWLGRVVGSEADDLSRHDKWLCMMYPRLSLLKDFLRLDGALFASIDENEYANLRALLDEIFGIRNRVGTIVWKNATDNNPTNISLEHEYVLCYARDKAHLPAEWKSETLAVKQRLLKVSQDFLDSFPDSADRQRAYSTWLRDNKAYLWPLQDYKFIDDGGVFTGMRAVHNPGKEGYRYDVIHPRTGKPCAQPLMGYRFPEETMKRLLGEGRIIFGEDESKIVELKVYVKEYRAKLSSVFELDGRVGTNELKEIFPENRRPFDFPKPTALIEELISFTSTEDDLILDSFAGSGTTGHAVLKLNKADGKRRRFILVEMKPEISREITAERVKRVAEGYVNAKGDRIEGLGGGFRYCRLGDGLFSSDGQITDSVSFADLARHVFFVTTGQPSQNGGKKSSPFIGAHGETAVYLLYNGILGDRRPGSGNVLTGRVLAELPEHSGRRVVFGEATTLSRARLRRENVEFRQIPYDVRSC